MWRREAWESSKRYIFDILQPVENYIASWQGESNLKQISCVNLNTMTVNDNGKYVCIGVLLPASHGFQTTCIFIYVHILGQKPFFLWICDLFTEFTLPSLESVIINSYESLSNRALNITAEANKRKIPKNFKLERSERFFVAVFQCDESAFVAIWGRYRFPSHSFTYSHWYAHFVHPVQ